MGYVRPILLCVLLLGACHDDDAVAPIAQPPVAKFHAPTPAPALPATDTAGIADIQIEPGVHRIVITREDGEQHEFEIDTDDDHIELAKQDPDVTKPSIDEATVDRDSDDIPDVEDRCPEVPDNSDEDIDGCPEPAPAAEVIM